jgi:single-stranded DNA-binding protein
MGKESMEEKIEMEMNNNVTIAGTILSRNYSHKSNYGETFDAVIVEVYRYSGTADKIPVLLSDRLVDTNEEIIGKPVLITGEFRSFNVHSEGKNRVSLNVFAKEIEFLDTIFGANYCRNDVVLKGFICKEPVFRNTPQGREICDLFLAVNRQARGKSDYLPCIAWGRNARYIAELPVSTKLEVCGRIQSREYDKKLENGEYETRTAYELSISVVKDITEVDEDEEQIDGHIEQNQGEMSDIA